MNPGGGLVAALLLIGPTGTATGAPEGTTTSVRIDVRAAADCTSRTDLVVRVEARAPRIQFADDAHVSARVIFNSARPGNVVAELVLASGGVEQPPRRVVARSCAEAADGIAFIIAITLDPTQRRSPPPPGVPPKAATPASPTPTPSPD